MQSNLARASETKTILNVFIYCCRFLMSSGFMYVVVVLFGERLSVFQFKLVRVCVSVCKCMNARVCCLYILRGGFVFNECEGEHNVASMK